MPLALYSSIHELANSPHVPFPLGKSLRSTPVTHSWTIFVSSRSTLSYAKADDNHHNNRTSLIGELKAFHPSLTNADWMNKVKPNLNLFTDRAPAALSLEI